MYRPSDAQPGAVKHRRHALFAHRLIGKYAVRNEHYIHALELAEPYSHRRAESI